MEQLTTLVSEKTGMPPEQSRQAVNIVLSYLKERLPAPVASQIDNVVSGSGGSGSEGMGGAAGAVGDMLGG